jgi:hypothetical protein
VAWWAWALIIWGSLASAAVLVLTVRLCEHVEWREALLTARDRRLDEQVEELLRCGRVEGLLPRARTTLRQVAASALHRRSRLPSAG